MGSIKLNKDNQEFILNLRKAKYVIKLSGSSGIEIFFNEQNKIQFEFENQEKRDCVFRKIEKAMKCHCCSEHENFEEGGEVCHSCSCNKQSKCCQGSCCSQNQSCQKSCKCSNCQAKCPCSKCQCNYQDYQGYEEDQPCCKKVKKIVKMCTIL